MRCYYTTYSDGYFIVAQSSAHVNCEQIENIYSIFYEHRPQTEDDNSEQRTLKMVLHGKLGDTAIKL